MPRRAARAGGLGLCGVAVLHVAAVACWSRQHPAPPGARGPLRCGAGPALPGGPLAAFAPMPPMLPLRHSPGAAAQDRHACGRTRRGLAPRGMLWPAPALLLRSLPHRGPDLLVLSASISSGLPPDPADDDATPEAAKGAAGDAEAAAADVDDVDEDYAQFETPNGLEENSAFHAVPGAENVGIAGAGDDVDAGSGAEGDIIRVILAVCRATQLTPNPALPSVDNKFEYLVVLQGLFCVRRAAGARAGRGGGGVSCVLDRLIGCA